MLDECAGGHGRRMSNHGIIVSWNHRTFRLPSGRHGKIETAEIGTSQVRTMVRQFEIDKECAGRMLPQLAGTF